MNLRCNLSKLTLKINFNPIGICECKQLYRELGLHLKHESVVYDNVGKLYDGPHLQIKIVNGQDNFFFRNIPYLIAGTEELNAYFRLNVIKFIRSNGVHIQNVQAYPEQ